MVAAEDQSSKATEHGSVFKKNRDRAAFGSPIRADLRNVVCANQRLILTAC